MSVPSTTSCRPSTAWTCARRKPTACSSLSLLRNKDAFWNIRLLLLIPELFRDPKSAINIQTSIPCNSIKKNVCYVFRHRCEIIWKLKNTRNNFSLKYGELKKILFLKLAAYETLNKTWESSFTLFHFVLWEVEPLDHNLLYVFFVSTIWVYKRCLK